MTEIVEAVYENGVPRLLQPVNLRDGQIVRVQVLSEEPRNEEEEVIQALVAAGRLSPPARGMPPPDPASEEERRELADRLGRMPGRPLSEIVIEDRGEW